MGIAEAIVTEARSLIDYDNIRVYRVDHDSGMCEPIAFQGVFMGVDAPTTEILRCRVGEGLTGWVAEHNETLVIGDAESDDRRILVGPTDGPESMLLVPMTYDDRVEGVIVLAKLGRNRFSADHEATLSIFAGHAAQAFVNADNAEQVATPAARARAPARQPAAPPRGQRDAPLDARPARRPRDDRRLAQGGRGVRLADDLPGRPGGVGPPGGRRPRPVRRRDHGVRRTARRRDHRLGHRPRRGGPGERRPPRSTLDPDPGHALRAGVDDRRPAGRRRRGHRHAQHRPDGPRGVALLGQRVRAHQAVRRTGLDRAPERRDPSGRRGPGRARLADRAAQPRRVPARARRRRRER